MGIQIKKFQASSFQKAIEMVRADLGDNAIILQTDKIKNPSAFGFSSEAIEVTAAIDRNESVPRLVPNEEPTPSEASPKTASALSKLTSFFGKKKPAATPLSDGLVKPPVSRPISKSAAQSVMDKPNVAQMYAMKTYIEPLQKEVQALKADLKTATTQEKKKNIKDPLELEVKELRREFLGYLNEQRYESIKLPNYFKNLMNFWNNRGMTTAGIFSLFRGIEDQGVRLDGAETSEESVSHYLSNSVVEGSRTMKKTSRIVVLVGPTGVGKTTTIAKMAAHEKLKQLRSTALMTIDDFKIGGSEQLASYARILEVPFVKTRADLSIEEQVKVVRADTIFIDTFGVSPTDTDRMQKLKRVLQFIDPDVQARLEIHLALPVGLSATDVPQYMKAFAELNPGYLLFTKWDETPNWGGMLTTILESQKPVSYICHGQNVPDDISVFSKSDFINLVTTIEN